MVTKEELEALRDSGKALAEIAAQRIVAGDMDVDGVEALLSQMEATKALIARIERAMGQNNEQS